MELVQNLVFPARGQFEMEPVFHIGYIDNYNGGYDIVPPGTPAPIQYIYQAESMPGVRRFVPFFGLLSNAPGESGIDTDWLELYDSSPHWEWLYVEVSRTTLLQFYSIENHIFSTCRFDPQTTLS